MHSPGTSSPSHPDQRIRDLIAACPSLAAKLDLSEGVYFVLTEVALLLRDRRLGEDEEGCLDEGEEDCVYAFLNGMALGDTETQNLLVVGVLEILGDFPESVDRGRARLGGRALLLFERVLRGWALRK